MKKLLTGFAMDMAAALANANGWPRDPRTLLVRVEPEVLITLEHEMPWPRKPREHGDALVMETPAGRIEFTEKPRRCGECGQVKP
jgi:hypothetical protein